MTAIYLSFAVAIAIYIAIVVVAWMLVAHDRKE